MDYVVFYSELGMEVSLHVLSDKVSYSGLL